MNIAAVTFGGAAPLGEAADGDGLADPGADVAPGAVAEPGREDGDPAPADGAEDVSPVGLHAALLMAASSATAARTARVLELLDLVCCTGSLTPFRSGGAFRDAFPPQTLPGVIP